MEGSGGREPRVSVAVVTYNQRDFLRACIESVLQQDYGNLEVVVADDGSTDGTVDLLRDYERAHPGKFLLVLAPQNRGIAANTNAAHAACTGKYVAWIAGDDLMLPGKLSAQVAHMEAHPECAISYHNLEVFDSDSGQVLRLFNTRRTARSGDLATLVRHGSFNGACSNMVRRSATPAHGFDARLGAASDWLYFVETLESGGEIHYLDRVLGRYRRHAGNVTGTTGVFKLEHAQDHLCSCAIILSRHPELAGAVAHRLSELLIAMRFTAGGASSYRRYLLASLRLRPSVKALGAAALSLFGVRR